MPPAFYNLQQAEGTHTPSVWHLNDRNHGGFREDRKRKKSLKSTECVTLGASIRTLIVLARAYGNCWCPRVCPLHRGRALRRARHATKSSSSGVVSTERRKRVQGAAL